MFSEFEGKGRLFQGLKPELRRNALCLLASIILHSLLSIILLNVASPVKVIQFKEEVTDLIIVPPEALFLPEGYQDFPGAGQYDDLFLRRGARERKPASREVLPEGESAGATEIPPPSERGTTPSQPEGQQAPVLKGRLVHRSGLASEFKLRIPAESDLDLSKTKKIFPNTFAPTCLRFFPHQAKPPQAELVREGLAGKPGPRLKSRIMISLPGPRGWSTESRATGRFLFNRWP